MGAQARRSPAYDTLCQSVECAFTRGRTISQVMDQFHVSYEFARTIKHSMRIPAQQTRRRSHPIRERSA